ncbi:hypothetical protein D7219_12480 [Legionella pneumophila]|uniref:ankyrin repeat domain-containing protein n=1 Tax=Legionella pneumophila TaxID=446 RepID=UPI00101E76AA|nr:ankyrin repeat domain-containing protein [Legionella pneumophila]RYW88246.1 hypothetical protein D7219_12480 [Legionella pneumophila]
MPKNKNSSNISHEELDKLRDDIESQWEKLGMNPFSKFKGMKAAKKIYKDTKTINNHVKEEKQYYWCGIAGGVVDVSMSTLATAAMATMTGAHPTAMLLSQPAISRGSKTCGDLAQRGCDAAVNFFINRSRYQSANTYNSRFIGLSGTNSFHASSTFSSSSNNSSYFNSYQVERTVKDAICGEMSRIKPSMDSAYLRAHMNLGLGYNLSRSEFRSLASSTNLISSYNLFNPSSKLSDVKAFAREIGGVAGEVATITDLIDSDAQAEADNYIFCFESDQFPFSKEMVYQIQQELKEAYFTHKTSPFFSLHFNNFGYLYPVIHPALQNTLVGQIIALLDYWMKGFLNGGIYDEEFLKIWHEIRQCDESFLKQKIIDLKKYCETNANGLPYISLRELMNRNGIKESHGSEGSPYKQPFMTSFRIIAYQEAIERHENILVPHPNFRIEYSIDLMPDYKNHVESYLQEHGHYPSDYQHTRDCYELFAEEIKEKMPKLPFCQDFFRLLGVMNTFSYFYATLDKMGKQPDLPPLTSTMQVSVPKAFPPIPVRYFETKPIDLRFKQVLQAIQGNLGSESALDELLFACFNTLRQRVTLPPRLVNEIKSTIEAIVKNHLLAAGTSEAMLELNQSELKNYSQLVTQLLTQQLQSAQFNITDTVKKSTRMLAQAERTSLAHLPLPARIQASIGKLEAHTEALLARWNANPALAQTEIFDILTNNMMVTVNKETGEKIKFIEFVRNKFLQIENSINEELPKQIEYIIKENEKEKNHIILILKNIADTKSEATQHIAKRQTTINEAGNAIAAIHEANVKNNGLIVQVNNSIAQVSQEFDTWYASIPPRLISLNQAIISQNRASTVQEIARLNAIVQEISNKIAQNNEFISKNNQLISTLQQDIANINAELPASINAFIREFFNDENQGLIEQIISVRLADVAGDLAPCIAKLNQHFQTKNDQAIEECNKRVSSKTILNELCKQKAEVYLKQIMTGEISRLSRHLSLLQHMVANWMTHEKLMNFPIAKTYTYSVIGFTGEALDKKTGDKFKIIGGCGVSLPNISTRVLAKSEQFCDALVHAFSASLKDMAEFTVDGRTYTALRIGVIEKSTAEDLLSDEQSSLCDVFSRVMNTGESLAVTNAGLSDVVDQSGASLIHYIASFLNAAQTSLVIETHPEQLYKRDLFGHLPIHAAAQANQADVVKYLLQKDPTLLEATNQRHATPLMTAIEYGCRNSVDTLLASGANVNHLLPSGLFPLMLAIQNNFSDIAIALIKNGRELNLNQKLDSGVTALHVAIENQMREVVFLLIVGGSALDISRQSDGYTAWHTAAALGELAMMQAMVAHGVSIKSVMESQKNALHLASEAGHLEVVNYLLSLGVPNAKTSDGDTPLMLALKAGQSQVAERLAEVIDINTTNKLGQSASLLAIQYGQVAVSDCLIARGENPLIEDVHGNSYLYYLVRNGEFHRFANLIESHSIPLDVPIHGHSLIHIAAQYGHFEIVYYLLDQGCSFIAANNSPDLLGYAVMADEIGYLREQFSGNSAPLVKLAAQAGSVRCLRFLLDKLSKEEIIAAELLKIAIKNGHVTAVDAIIKKQGDMRCVIDHLGNTPLHLAAATGNTQIIELVVKSGADFLIQNAKQQTAFHLAFANNDAQSFKKLLRLSQPAEWPADLWSMNRIRLDSNLKKLLVKYEKRLPKTALQQKISANITAESVLEDRIQGERRQELISLLNDQEFDDAIALLSQPGSQFGEIKNLNEVLRLTLENTYDYAELFDAQDDELTPDTDLPWKPDRLLAFLKSKGMDPSCFTGRRNPLLSILASSNDEEACYRLTLFAKVFPECIAALVQDKVISGKNCAELALIKRFNQFFDQCDSLCRLTQAHESPNYNALHQAVASDNYELTKQLLSRTSVVDCLNAKGQTPLMLAALQGNVTIAQLLIAGGAQPDRCDHKQLNSLHYAILGKSETVALHVLPLLRQRHYASQEGMTPLLYAAQQGMLSVVSALCSDSNALNQVDSLGRNALHLAALHGHVHVIKYLAQRGFRLDQVECPSSEKRSQRSLKRTALHYAALKAQLDAVVTLLQLGADMYATDVIGNGLCEYAVISQDPEMLRFVQSMSLYHQPERSGKILRAGVMVDHPEVVSEMILNGRTLTTLDESGNSVLHSAARNNSGEAIELLLQGDDIPLNLKNRFGDTPLHVAARFGHVRIIEALLEAGAIMDQKNDGGTTALILAAQEGKLGAVITLLKYQADYSIKDATDLTAAQTALLNGHLQIACRIVMAGDQSLQPVAVEQLSTRNRTLLYEKMTDFERQLQHTANTASLCQLGLFKTLEAHADASLLRHLTRGLHDHASSMSR